MSEAEAIKAYREMLPVETIGSDISSGKIRKFGMPIGLLYERNGALFTQVHLIVPEGERATSRYPIEKLKLSENTTRSE